MISMALIIIILLIFHVDYDTYESGAKYLSYFLTPATVALAVPLYEQIEPLKKNWKAILAGIFAGAMTSALCVLVLSLIFKLSHKQYCHTAFQSPSQRRSVWDCPKNWAEL